MFFSRLCRCYAAHFTPVGAAFYATARASTARFSAVCCRRYGAHFTAVGAFTLRPGKMLPVVGLWCRRYAAHFTAVGAAFVTTARVNAARFPAVSVGVMLAILLLLAPPFKLRRG